MGGSALAPGDLDRVVQEERQNDAHELSDLPTMRSKRLFHLLQQNFTGYSKIENLIKSQISALGITESKWF